MPQQTNSKPLSSKGNGNDLSPSNAVKLDTLSGVRGEMARMYRLALKGTVAPEEMTKFIYALKEIRGCIESEQIPAMIGDIQARLAALTATGARR